MEYMSCPEAAKKWGISERRVQVLCRENRIPGVSKLGYMWLIPKDAENRLTGEQNEERSCTMNKVLIIDDDKELCALMKKCIEQEKLSAVTVYNGIEGVRLIDENKDSYSLIILDVMLPDIDGFQILQKLEIQAISRCLCLLQKQRRR